MWSTYQWRTLRILWFHPSPQTLCGGTSHQGRPFHPEQQKTQHQHQENINPLNTEPHHIKMKIKSLQKTQFFGYASCLALTKHGFLIKWHVFFCFFFCWCQKLTWNCTQWIFRHRSMENLNAPSKKIKKKKRKETTTLAKKIETGTQAKHRRVHAW